MESAPFQSMTTDWTIQLAHLWTLPGPILMIQTIHILELVDNINHIKITLIGYLLILFQNAFVLRNGLNGFEFGVVILSCSKINVFQNHKKKMINLIF